MFEPPECKPGDRRSCFLTIHGGGWTGYDPRRQYAFAAHFAKLGMVGISLEYRLAKQGSGVTVFDCVKDGRSAVRYIRAHAAELGIDPNKLICNGGSAGGHLAAGTALFAGCDETGDDLSVSCVPNALVLYYPVIDTSEQGYGTLASATIGAKSLPCTRCAAACPRQSFFMARAMRVCRFKASRHSATPCKRPETAANWSFAKGVPHGYLMFDRRWYEDTLQKTESFLISLGLLEHR